MPSIIYVDYKGGIDANDGLSFATRKKTLSAATLTTVASAGDQIRVMQSDDPVYVTDALWTNRSPIVTLSASPIYNLYYDGAWTAAANVTATASTTRKQGSTSAQMSVAAGWTANSKMAYYPLTATADLSSYTKLSFWILTTTSQNLDGLRINLCSDATGDTPVNVLYLSAGKSTGTFIANTWVPITIDNGGSLSSNINSISVTSSIDNGAFVFVLDNIFATNNINLQGLISKNSYVIDNEWYSIRAIESTKLIIDSIHNSQQTAASRGYIGNTETTSLYYRDPILVDMATALTTNMFTFVANGSAGNLIDISGGWNSVDMSTQAVTATTVFSGLNGNGALFAVNNADYNKLSNFIVMRTAYGIFHSNATANYNQYYNIGGVSLAQPHFSFSFSGTNGVGFILRNNWTTGGLSSFAANNIKKSIITDHKAYSLTDNGFTFTSCNTTILSGISSYNNTGEGIEYSSCNTFYNNNIHLYYNNQRGILMTNASQITTNNCVLSANAGGALYVQTNSSDVLFYNLSCFDNTLGVLRLATATSEVCIANLHYNEPLLLYSTVDYTNSKLYVTYEQGLTNNHAIYMDGGTIASSTTITHNASGISWRIQPTSTIRDVSFPVQHRVGHVFVTENVPLTASVYLYRDSLDISGNFKCFNSQLQGITEQSVSMTAATGIWERVSLLLTPQQTGFIEFYVEAYGGTTHSVYWDDFSCTSSLLDASSGDYSFIREGVIVQTAPGGSVVSESNVETAWTFS